MKNMLRALLALTIGAVVLSLATPAGADNIGNEGCTPGFWKNHPEAWEEYNENTLLSSVFTLPAGVPDATFATALTWSSGPTVVDAAKNLLKHAVAAFLNAASEEVGYPYRRFTEPFNIQAQVNAALASGSRSTMNSLKDVLDAANNLGCPI